MNLAALSSIFLFLLIVFKIVRRPNKSESPPNLPPGPRKLPIIGNIHNLIGSLPHHGLRDLSRKYGPLMHLQLGEVSTIIVSSAEFAKEITKTHDLIFASRPPILASTILSYDNKGLTFAPYGDYWIQLRKISAMELFSWKRVQSLWPIREEEFSDLIRRIASKEGSVINLTKEVVQSISAITARSAFGRKCKDNDEFLKVVKEALAVAAGFNIGDLYPSAIWLQNMTGLKGKLEKLRQRIDGIMENIIKEHKVAKSRAMENQAESDEDLIDVLLKFQENNQMGFHLSNDNIKAVILDVFGGGSETLTTTIAWAMAEMIKDVRSLKKAQSEVREVFDRRGKADGSGIDELKYLKLVVKETLRLHSPGPLLLPRECSQAIEIKGYHIPLKSKIIINAWAIGRDPNYWTEPERFYPERFIDSCFDYNGTHLEYIPFGAGRRICPGMAFGLVSIELGLALLLYHFDWKLPEGMRNEDLDMTEAFGIAVIRKNDLNLIPITHSALPVSATYASKKSQA